jgi:hypothetical protein
MRKENVRTSYLLHLSTTADSKISDQPWVKFQSAGWVNIQSAPTARLVEGQLEALSKAPITLHDADPIELRESLEKFLVLLPNKDDQARFRGHAAMIDSLISNLQQHNQP